MFDISRFGGEPVLQTSIVGVGDVVLPTTKVKTVVSISVPPVRANARTGTSCELRGQINPWQLSSLLLHTCIITPTKKQQLRRILPTHET